MAGWRATISAVAVVWTFLARVESQNMTVEPRDFGATTGDKNILIRCSVTNLGSVNFISWTYNPSWINHVVTIFSSYYNTSVETANFSVKSYVMQNVSYADLTIKTAQLGLGARYTCFLNPAIHVTAHSYLVVLDPLECPESQVEYDEGDVANFSCSVNYTTRHPSQTPQLTWQLNGVNQTGGVYENDPSGTRRTLSLRKTLTAQDDGDVFVCVVTVAHSQPSYTNNCSTTVFVSHGVSQVYINPPSSPDKPVTVPVGAIINCTSNGRPQPSLIWTNMQNAIVSETGELVVTNQMSSWKQPVTLNCVANGTGSGAVGKYTFYVGNPAMVQAAGTKPWIAAAVLVPIAVIALIAIGAYFFVRRRNKKQQTIKKPIKGSNASRPPTTATTGGTIYTPIATTEVPYTSASRPPPSTAPRTGSSNRGPPGPDNRNGGGGGDSPGFGDLGAQPYAGSVHGSNPAIIGTGVSMNPNPGYPVRGSNPVLNVSAGSNQRPSYPYTGSQSPLNASLTLNGAPGVGVGRQPSIASSSGRSHTSSYNAGVPPVDTKRRPNDQNSVHGSEV